jgi:hypothetical protein
MTRLLWCAAQFLLIVLCASEALLAASESNFGFLWICSVRAAAHKGEPQKLVGGVVIGVYPSTDKGHRESFTITDQTGYAMIPLRPGNYCAEAYGSNGRKLSLDGNTNGGRPVCFDISARKVKEAGVTISHDVDYKPDIPSKGVD